MVKLSQSNQPKLPREKQSGNSLFKKLLGRRYTILFFLVVLFAIAKPQQFFNLWFTPDQQGQIYFKLGDYQTASQSFENVQWQAFSSYGAEEYKNAATLYNQFNDVENKIARANALAHHRDYLKARNLYQDILLIEANNLAALTNLPIVQAIIDETNLLSASQQPEQGESNDELGEDDARAADGADREVARQQEIEQLSSEQLLLDASLNEMWLKQVQKNPGRFLAQKFHMQLEADKSSNRSSDKASNISSNTVSNVPSNEPLPSEENDEQ